MTTVFTPLTKGFSWALSTVDESGNPLPSGEVNEATTIGIRADGDTAHGVGQYQYFVTLAPNATQATLNQVLAAKVPAGANYWAAIDQTDGGLNSTTITSVWSSEIPFSIPVQLVKPAAPSNFSVA